jgi:hypothetical protein
MDAANVSPPGFNPQTIESVASHYTNYAILDHTIKIKKNIMEGGQQNLRVP